MQQSYFIYDRSSLVKPSFIKFFTIYCSVSNFSKKKSKIILATNQKILFIEKSTEKSELLVHIAKVSGQKIETTDQKIHNFQLKKNGEKRRGKNDNY